MIIRFRGNTVRKIFTINGERIELTFGQKVTVSREEGLKLLKTKVEFGGCCGSPIQKKTEFELIDVE